MVINAKRKTRDSKRLPPRQRGIVAVLAMMFIVIFSALAAAMAIVSQGNLRTADTYQHVNRSLSAAETGMNFCQYRVAAVANTITTNKGLIDQGMSDTLWPLLRDGIVASMGNDLHCLQPPIATTSVVTIGPIRVGDLSTSPTFTLTISRHPLVGENYNSATYQKAPYNQNDGDNPYTANGMAVTAANPIGGWWLRVRSVGTDSGYSRSVQLDCRMDKKVRFAMLSRSRLMLGPNVFVSGPVGSRFNYTGVANGHPIQMKDNFRGFDTQLDGWIDAFNTYLAAHDTNGDNRVRLADTRESGQLDNAASYDKNGDGYVDSADLFLMRFDANGDGKITADEFTKSDGTMYEPQLWKLMNEAKYPAGTQFDWTNYKVMLPGSSVWTDAKSDLTMINGRDQLAKLAGQVSIIANQDTWQSGAANGSYHNVVTGPIKPDTGAAPITFNASDQALPPLGASNFDSAPYKALATGNFASQVSSNTASGTGTYTAPSNATLESVPYGSPYPYDFYQRPVYTNMNFDNVTIPKGTNALFVNCTFTGVTFVDTETNNTDKNYNYAGATDPSGASKYVNLTATVNGSLVADTKPLSNNVRFQDCTFKGMVASAAPTGFTHIRNKIAFTGNTKFDLSTAGANKQLYERSTIFAPQYSVEMGTFTAPTNPNEVTALNGTIIAGVMDLRGQATVDGSIITTFDPQPGQGPLANGGNPANFNTTIGYFSSAEGDSESELPSGGARGKILIRYNPKRALPDGILGPIEVAPDNTTYVEAGQ